MNLATLQTPGVYIVEKNALSNSGAPVPTAVPAFIGYTPQAAYAGRSYLNKAQKISSFPDFQAFYCYPDVAAPANSPKQYAPSYWPVKPLKDVNNANTAFRLVPDPNTIYYLYNSIKLFYANGGGDAYIVSIGTYGPPSKAPW